MKQIALLIPVMTTMLLTGCSNDPKEPNPDNFKLALKKHFEAKGCVDFNVSEQAPSNKPLWPFKVDKRVDIWAQSFNQLINVGLVTREAQKQGYHTLHIYSLTDEGKKALKSPNSLGFCGFDYEVQDIVEWSEPKIRGGVTKVKVTFNAKPVNVRPWATKPGADLMVGEANRVKKLRRTLTLTDDGWVVK